MLEYRLEKIYIDRKDQPLAYSSTLMRYNCVCRRSPGDSRRGEVRVKSSVVRSPAKARKKRELMDVVDGHTDVHMDTTPRNSENWN